MRHSPNLLGSTNTSFLHEAGTVCHQHAASDQTQLILGEDIEFLQRYGIEREVLCSAQRRAQRLQLAPAACLMASGQISPTNYYRCVAFELRLNFVHAVPPSGAPFFEVPDPSTLEAMAYVVTVDQSAKRLRPTPVEKDVFMAPDCRQFTSMKELIFKNPDLQNRIQITTPAANRASLIRRFRGALTQRAVNFLNDTYPRFSAKRVISVPQTVSLIIILQFLMIIALYSTGLALLLLHLVASTMYIGCIWLRLLAFKRHSKTRKTAASFTRIRYADQSLPHYSILIPLYKEAGQVRDLVNALLKTDWPKEKLEIMLLCEIDDKPTLEAVKTVLDQCPFPHISLVKIPVSHPRTKPKALNFALPLCKGEFVVVYDAEDRPHPQQLREAHARFLQSGPGLACLQAPLSILNHRENWLSGLFCIEYSALFDGLLPFLSSIKGPVPLGGTSNHFKREVLVSIGGWDPYNVTEDADLGVRLARAGCEVDVLNSPTLEEAPIDMGVWLKQRTRWFKGWFQTWLVHMRNPLDLISELGLKGTVIFHLMITGMSISALIHPFLLYFIALRSAEIYHLGTGVFLNPLLVLDVFTICLGYIAFALLALKTLPERNLDHLKPKLWLVPIYWMMLSAAAWRALWHLLVRPHEWEKTEHRLRLKHPG